MLEQRFGHTAQRMHTRVCLIWPTIPHVSSQASGHTQLGVAGCGAEYYFLSVKMLFQILHPMFPAFPPILNHFDRF
jgi:hypothetical protein